MMQSDPTSVTFVSFKTGQKQHILRSERHTYCGEHTLPNPGWADARYDTERNDLDLCKVCERLGPLDEQDQRNFWKFTDEDVQEVWPEF